MTTNSNITDLQRRALRPNTKGKAASAIAEAVAEATEAPELTPEEQAAQAEQRARTVQLFAGLGEKAIQSSTELLVQAAASNGEPLVVSMAPMQAQNEAGEAVGEPFSGMVIAVFGTIPALQAQLNAIQPILDLGKQVRSAAAATPAEAQPEAD